MNASELYNLSIAPLVTKPFALEWSEDNHISLVTMFGVHVFEFVPHPMSINSILKFWRTFIYSSAYSPMKAYQKFVNESIWQLKREEINELLLTEALTTEITDRIQPQSRIISISWSPRGLSEPSRSLCAVVNSLGSVEILCKRESKWFSVWNVTELWVKILERENDIDESNVAEKVSGNSWISLFNRFLGTTATWSPIFGKSPGEAFAFLVSAFRSSDIVFCRVEKIGEFAETKDPTVVLKSSLNVDSRIVTLLWIPLVDKKSHLILVGYYDGKIHGLKVLENEGKLEQIDFFKYEDKADKMTITCLKKLRDEDGKFVVLATKSSCLVALDFDKNGNCFRKRYLKVPGFSITGLAIPRDDLAILTTQNARLFSIKISQNGEMSQQLLKHDLKTTKVQYLGLASSPNSAILLNVTSPDGIFDHLINREPSTMQIFTLKDDEFDPWRIIEKKVSSEASLYDYWDCIESLRIRAWKEEKILPKLPGILDGSSINKLRVVMWLSLISEVVEKRQLLKGVEKIVGEISEAQPLIFLTAACEHLSRLSRKRSLEDFERKSASFLRMFLEVYLAGEEEQNDDDEGSTRIEDNDRHEEESMTRKAMKVFKESSHVDTLEIESCELCDEILSDLPWTIDTCPLGHKLARCSISLLQITSVSYRSCPICGRLFHPSLDAEYEEIRCIYCDVPAVYDHRVANLSKDAESNVGRWKNLSETTIPQDRPKTVKSTGQGEKNKRSLVRDLQTFAVIVDNENGDDCPITETWQAF